MTRSRPGDPEPDGEEKPERITVPEGVESTLPEDVPRIHLALFEGPLDFLLYLIRRDKIDIYDIPIAPITRDYMEYLDLMQELNLDVAGEFMVMAATLIHIKSKMLVPVEPTEAEGEEDYVDPREELVRRLLELQRYKEAAGLLHQQAQIRAAQWTRPDTVLPTLDDSGEEMLEAGLYDLIAAFKELLDRRKSLLAHEIETEGPSVEERMVELLAMIVAGESLEFLELFASLETKGQMITTFLALLELVRLKQVRVYQRGGSAPSVSSARWARPPRERPHRRRGEGPLAEKHAKDTHEDAPVAEEQAAVEPDTAEAADGSVLPPRELRAIVEAMVFAAPQPLTAREIGRVLGGVGKEDWQRALQELKESYAGDDRGLQLIEVAGGWQITTRPEYNDWVRELLDPKVPTRLSIQALETLAVIAYRQPATLPEIIELRGVRSQGVVKTLLEKRLIRITGRKEVVGRPMLYGTTKQFLLHFGLKDLDELPQIEEFAEVLGEEVDVPGLKRAIEAPSPTEVPLADGEESSQGTLFEGESEGETSSEAEPSVDGDEQE